MSKCSIPSRESAAIMLVRAPCLVVLGTNGASCGTQLKPGVSPSLSQVSSIHMTRCCWSSADRIRFATRSCHAKTARTPTAPPAHVMKLRAPSILCASESPAGATTGAMQRSAESIFCRLPSTGQGSSTCLLNDNTHRLRRASRFSNFSRSSASSSKVHSFRGFDPPR